MELYMIGEALMGFLSFIGNVVFVGIQLFCFFFVAYYSIISIWGMIKRDKVVPEVTRPITRFAVLVCAHNEERVVKQIVTNLLELDYPSDMYDIYVIADNCTDETAQRVRESGAIALERHDPEHKSKGYGIEWALGQIWSMDVISPYNAVAIFDADNLVSRNFLRVMDRKIQNGAKVIQGYLDSKNPGDNWITKSYAFSYWATNIIFQRARERIGLSAQLGGTGMVFDMNVLKEFGWGSKCLTEDLEFTIDYMLRTGDKVAWAHEARVYDEKPTSFKVSWVQRIRWMIGHFDCAMRFGGPALKKAWKTESLLIFDGFLYLIQPSRVMLTLFLLSATIASFFGVISKDYKLFSGWGWFAMVIIYTAIPIIGLIIEGQGRKFIWAIQSYFFGLTWMPIVWIGFFRRNQKVWSHTKHDRIVSEEETKRMTGI